MKVLRQEGFELQTTRRELMALYQERRQKTGELGACQL